jgi:hypothetical protein
MPGRTPNRKKQLAEWIAREAPPRIDEAAWRELLERFAPVSARTLRRLLAEAGVPVEAPYGGVRQRSFEELAASLAEMGRAYQEALERNRIDKAHLCRMTVIEAKDHARLASKNPRVAEDKRRQKAEMVEWMLVWLENPPIFPLWSKLRMARQRPQPDTPGTI